MHGCAQQAVGCTEHCDAEFFQWDTAALAPRAVQSEGTVFELERHLMGGQDGYLHY